MSNKFYLTTPIYYVNARPHIGTTYTTVVADVIARRKRALGIDTFFLTGTDEHGQKIERSAEKAGCSPQEFTDKVSAQFRALWDRMGLTYDDFIRTTEPRHTRSVQKLFTLLKDRGFIYKDTYTGQYCVSDEAFVDVAPGAPCPDCGRITETVSEENYFFKLSAFERTLLEYYEAHPEFIRPETRRNEVISFVKAGLKDLSISRTSFKWGIPVPGDEKHVIYVWMDALANYITALGWGSDDTTKFDKYWTSSSKRLHASTASTGRHS
jgi:methionyl-tRNA synthetase